MIQTVGYRFLELERIQKVKDKLAVYRLKTVRINEKTWILVREGRDINEAIASFYHKQELQNQRDCRTRIKITKDDK